MTSSALTIRRGWPCGLVLLSDADSRDPLPETFGGCTSSRQESRWPSRSFTRSMAKQWSTLRSTPGGQQAGSRYSRETLNVESGRLVAGNAAGEATESLQVEPGVYTARVFTDDPDYPTHVLVGLTRTKCDSATVHDPIGNASSRCCSRRLLPGRRAGWHPYGVRQNGSVPPDHGPDNWEVVAALATVLSAIAGAVGAIAAWRSASASRRTSQQAAEALANTIIPQVRSRGVYGRAEGERLEADVVIANDAPFPAQDVHVTVERRDGHRFEATRRWMRANDEVLIVAIGAIAGGTNAGYEALVLDRVIIRFTDERGIATYERRENFSRLTEPPCDPEWTEVRIAPTQGPLVRMPTYLT